MEVMELCWRSLCVWDLLMVSSFFPLFLCPGLLCLGKPSLSSLRPCYSAVVAPLSIALQKCKSEMCYIQSGSPTICLVLVLGIFLQDAFCHMLDLSFSRRLIVKECEFCKYLYISLHSMLWDYTSQHWELIKVIAQAGFKYLVSNIIQQGWGWNA